jgi:hypothetical protein
MLKAPAHNPTDSNASPAYAALPNPSVAHPLRNPDQRFLDSEAFTNKFASHISGPMEKVTRRSLKRWSDDAQDHSELGAALNGFSLNESGELSAAIEKTGQAVDATYISTARLVRPSFWQYPFFQFKSIACPTVTRTRAKLGRTTSRVLPIRVHNQKNSLISPSKTCSIRDDTRWIRVEA